MKHILGYIEPLQELVGVFNCSVGAPVLRGVDCAEVAVEGGDGFHPCGAAGDDVAFVVADVDAGFGRQAQAAGGFKQRRGMRLGMRRGVSAHDGARTVEQRHGAGQRVGKA